ncbi:MAG: SDR family NAD(P)-dependent oxidoreductase [Rhizobiales bacterium]|nr:SDR family NAD(P)-dependent oxidoreductase [Hyphomicrobiales bacterium]NRB13011.1 SDR family NAD(P)-dependent oxidoreductase [Hyphomicrobiales bacterium]
MTKTEKCLDGRIALIVGATRGIGYQVALEYARCGAHVIATARTVGGLEDLNDAIDEIGGTVTCVPVDVTDYEAIDRLGGIIHERYGRLDILVSLPAFRGATSPVSHISIKDFEDSMAINVTANFRLLRSVDALLRQSDAGRVVMATAAERDGEKPYWASYAAGKAGLHALVKTYAAELENMAVNVNMVDPTKVNTGLFAKAYPGVDKTTIPKAKDVVSAFVKLGRADCFYHNNLLTFDPDTKQFDLSQL